MLYGKHPMLGNAHFPDEQRADRESAGWVIWPRTLSQKTAAPVPPPPPEAEPSEPPQTESAPRPQARRGVMR